MSCHTTSTVKSYLRDVPDVVGLEHLPGVGGVADVLERLGRVHARVLEQDLLAAGMLQIKEQSTA